MIFKKLVFYSICYKNLFIIIFAMISNKIGEKRNAFKSSDNYLNER